MSRTACSLAMISLTAIASADPVVAHFEGDLNEVLLRDIDPGFPDLLLYEWVWSGAGTQEYGFEAAPATASGGSDRCGTPGLVEWLSMDTASAETDPGTLVPGPDANGDWMPAYICSAGSAMPGLALGSSDTFDWPCDWFPPFPFTVVDRSDTLLYPLRVDQGDGSFRFGWMAVQLASIRNETCDPPCTDSICLLPRILIIGAGFETEPDTPIIVGGGLCEADLNFDAVLDLADVQAFIGAFIDQQPPADLNGDGVYDLADVQAFIDAFLSGCAL